MKNLASIFMVTGLFAGILLLGAGVSEGPPSWIPASDDSNIRTLRKNWRVITLGINRFIHAQVRYPDSFDELCKSPYIAVRCKDLMNPYTGRPIQENLDSAGDFIGSVRDGGLSLTNWERVKVKLNAGEVSFDAVLKGTEAVLEKSPQSATSTRLNGLSHNDRVAVPLCSLWCHAPFGGRHQKPSSQIRNPVPADAGDGIHFLQKTVPLGVRSFQPRGARSS